VSPSSSESLRIGLCPDRLIFARYGRGLRPRLIEKGALSFDTGIAEEPWRAAVAALPKLLQAHAPRAADATVVLSNHFVRYALLGANDRLSSREEWLEYASHHFEKTYGMRARDWDIQISESGAAHPRLASAIDKALLAAAAAAFENGRARLRSIQPYLMIAFNRALPSMGQSSFWFVAQEPGRLLLGLVRDGLWRSVRARQTSARWCEELPRMLEREGALLTSAEPCGDVLVSALEPVEPAASNGFKFTTPPSPLSGDERAYAMVCS
jgi:hypothetical protein